MNNEKQEDAITLILKHLKTKLLKKKQESLSILKNPFSIDDDDDIKSMISTLNMFTEDIYLSKKIDLCVSNLQELNVDIHNRQKNYSSYSVLDASILFISTFIDKMFDLMKIEHIDKDIRIAMFDSSIKEYVKFIKKYTNINLNSDENKDFNTFVEYYNDEMKICLDSKRELNNILKYSQNTLLYTYKIMLFIVYDIFYNTIKEKKLSTKQKKERISNCINDINNIIKIYANVNVSNMINT